MAACVALAAALVLSAHHSHTGDGRVHADCAVCMFSHEGIAETALSVFVACGLLIGLITPVDPSFRPALRARETTGRSPPILPS